MEQEPRPGRSLEATLGGRFVLPILNRRSMDRTRSETRAQLIRLSMLLFSVLAIASFALARVAD
ncbi:MAG: hypothetical protein IPH05_13325 [Flavobacteriales bacterium]|jgi:hypothetical protein|nr:hypothetical protein [Flavobacteriales bacterium]MBK7110979.1 hypothetical protein [Flavobacteriales bacterium]MBK9628654.1 hypothetical protein [Flavobacteriales bacterium]MBP8876948.1 hypothetical protein [Flavobacteriales bacterium]MBP9176253.1 hypothetical protein [Flavobacteriales bacterium]